MKKKNKAIYLLFLMPFVYFATACFVMWLVKTSGIYPSGSDTMYHVYRGDYVYNAIKSGNWYPLYDPAWYNGVEILRYWSPLPAYVMAFCQYLAGGSQFGAVFRQQFFYQFRPLQETEVAAVEIIFVAHIVNLIEFLDAVEIEYREDHSRH